MRGKLEAACLLSLGFLLIHVILRASPLAAAPRALIVDYEMNPPVVLARLLADLRESGFLPLYRPHYPRLTWKDLKEASLVILLSGNTPGYPGAGMSRSSIAYLAAYVKSGGILLLGPSSGGPGSTAGDHERGLFNDLLRTLCIPITIQDDWIQDRENAFAAPLYRLPFARAVPGHPITEGLKGRMVTDRCPSLNVGSEARALLETFPSAFPHHRPQSIGVYTLAALSEKETGTVAVMGRYLLQWGGGCSKEPARPLLPLPKEEKRLHTFLRGLLYYLRQKTTKKRPPLININPQAVPSSSERGDPAQLNASIPRRPPPNIVEFHGPPSSASVAVDPSSLAPPYEWILREGIRGGWAHIDKDADELDRLTRGLSTSGMNLLWGVGFPQLLLSPKGDDLRRARLLLCWERVARGLRGTGVRWFLGMEYPGSFAVLDNSTRAIGSEGEIWDVPSPWDLEVWRREVVRPARIAAQWARREPSVAGIVLDVEMYGRKPLFFGQGLDFGDAPFLAFLRNRGELEAGSSLRPRERFPWLRDRGLLQQYYDFLEQRAELMGRELRQAIHSIHPGLILGSYSAGALQRWFYRGLWRGMSTPERPLVLFTFQRDLDPDQEALAREGIHVLHVRALLMGLLRREDYPRLFDHALRRNWGYWLNRLTALVADRGFYPAEAPQDMEPEEAWRVIAEANRMTPFLAPLP